MFRNLINRIRRPGIVNDAQRRHVHLFPVCAACDVVTKLEGHHIIPYEVEKSLGALDSNFITLCVTCHLAIGHAGGWRYWNPSVVTDAAEYRGANGVRRRVLLDGIRAKRKVIP